MTTTAAKHQMEFRRFTIPLTAAVAGILFALLFTTSLILFRSAIPEDPSTGVAWAKHGASRIYLAMGLMPFDEIAFPRFVGLGRDRLERTVDRFSSTVFFGSGLLICGLILTVNLIEPTSENEYRVTATTIQVFQIK